MVAIAIAASEHLARDQSRSKATWGWASRHRPWITPPSCGSRTHGGQPVIVMCMKAHARGGLRTLVWDGDGREGKRK